MCDSSEKRCLNCDGLYRTLAASCPIRKALLKDIKEKDQNTPQRAENTYAGMAQKAARKAIEQTALTPQPQIHIQAGMHTKMVALILEAHIACLGNPKKQFSDTLAESLLLNYGIETKFPDRNSQEIFNLFIDPSRANSPPLLVTPSDTPPGAPTENEEISSDPEPSDS